MILLAHGGAGRKTRATETPYQRGMQTALRASADRAALFAVVAAIAALEKDPLFNAGRGSVLAADGQARMDASLACSQGKAGAVGDSLLAHSPIQAALEVLQRSPHTLLVGEAADSWLQNTSAPGSRVTEDQLRLWRKWQAGDDEDSLGTVGAVALDRDGHLAAGTSTGGMRGKQPGRVGDSAIFGAGTWCCSEVAISLTGDGDTILRRSSAARIAREIVSGQDPVRAIQTELRLLQEDDADAGCIVLQRGGRWWAMRNCTLMNWGVKEKGRIHVPRATD